VIDLLAVWAPVGEARVGSLLPHTNRGAATAAGQSGPAVYPQPFLRITASGRSSEPVVGRHQRKPLGHVRGEHTACGFDNRGKLDVAQIRTSVNGWMQQMNRTSDL
jgi:hypothetical protein